MNSSTTASDLEGLDAADAFITASRALVGMAIRSVSAAASEVTLPQHRLMVLLAAGGPQGVGSLAEQLNVDQSNASRLCGRLERLDLVARQRSSVDGRAVEVHLTASGTKVLRAVEEHRRREVQEVLSRMPEDAVGHAVQALAAFGRAAHERTGQDWSVPVC